MAGYGALRQDLPTQSLSASAVARVNDINISRDDFDRAMQRLAPGDGSAAPPDAQAAVIEILVNDELLLQRGLELGMAQSDVTIRTAVVNSLIASVTAEADAASPTDEQLATYLAEHADRFSYTSRVAVRAWQTDDESIAQSFAAAVRTGKHETTIDGMTRIPDLPDALLTLDALRDYLGPGITAAVANMPANSSSVFARRGRWVVVHVVEKETAVADDLAAIRNRVLIDYRRSLADEMLKTYLEELRERASISVALP